MNDYEILATAIIKGQEHVIGPIAWSEAVKVPTIVVNKDGQVTVKGDGPQALESLTNQYARLFGQASIEACKDAIHPLLPSLKNVKLPPILI